MKRIIMLLIVAAVVVPAFAGGGQESVQEDELKIAWYAPAVHPFFEEVKKGVADFEQDYGIEVAQQIGPAWTQESEDNNVQALAAKGYRGFSIFPVDPSAANGLYEELVQQNIKVVNFGATTIMPTDASFYVGTNIKQAAMDATEKLVDILNENGKILNVLGILEDANTLLRKEGIEEVVAKYSGIEIVQEIGGAKTIEEATVMIENALSTNIDKIDAIISTDYLTTVAASQLLSELNDKNDKYIHFVGIDTDPVTMKALENGFIDCTFSQNPYGMGYIGLVLAKYLLEGYEPKPDAYNVWAGHLAIIKDNFNSWNEDIKKITQDIVENLESNHVKK